jgi:hypothetical protein
LPSMPAPLLGITSYTAPFAGAVAVPIPNMFGDSVSGQSLGLIGDDSTNNAAAFAKLNNVPPGSIVHLRPGRYRYTGSIPMNISNITLAGSGCIQTTLVPLTTNQPAMTINAGFVGVKDLGFDRITKPVSGGDGIVCAQGMSHTNLDNLFIQKQYRGLVLGATDISYADRMTVQLCESHGLDFLYGTNGAVQYELTNILSQHNLGDGFHGVNTTAVTGIGPFLTDCHAFNNALQGYYFSGSASFKLFDVFMERCISSSDALGGIHFDGPNGEFSMVHDCWVELIGRTSGFPRGFDGTLSTLSNTGYGIRVSGSQGSSALNIVGGLIWSCAWSGISLESPNVDVVGMTLIDNGAAVDANIERRAGVLVKGNGQHTAACHFIKSAVGSGQLKGVTVGAGTYSEVSVDSSNHFTGYANITDMVDTSLATLSGTVSSRFPLGAQINVGRLALVLNDETGGANPVKPIRISAGALQILNSAGTSVIHSIDESATANDMRLLLWDVTSGTLKRVSRGAPDSESLGFRNLRVPN